MIDCEKIKMRIGMYAEAYVSEVPSDYLKYVAENWDENSDFKRTLIQACNQEWQWREDNNCHISNKDFQADQIAKKIKRKRKDGIIHT